MSEPLVRRVLLALLVLTVLWALWERRERQAQQARWEQLEAREVQVLKDQLEAWVVMGLLERREPLEQVAARAARVQRALQEPTAPMAATVPPAQPGAVEPLAR